MIRKAKINEVPEIRQFLAQFNQDIIPRPLAYLYENLRDYYVHLDGQGRIIGTAALHINWHLIGEIRSLAVVIEHQRTGIGKGLMGMCLAEAVYLGLEKVFLLCRIPEYFSRWGFKVVRREDLPPTAWYDCVHCTRFPDCDEVPMVLNL
jgi:amino-acid N-acetyltransferase